MPSDKDLSELSNINPGETSESALSDLYVYVGDTDTGDDYAVSLFYFSQFIRNSRNGEADSVGVDIEFSAGNGGPATAEEGKNGGECSISSGNGSAAVVGQGGRPGGIYVNTGNVGDSATDHGRDSADIEINTTDGGAGDGTNKDGGDGGSIVIELSRGGARTGSGTSGDGGDFSIDFKSAVTGGGRRGLFILSNMPTTDPSVTSSYWVSNGEVRKSGTGDGTFKHKLIEGGAAGNFTVTGIATADSLLEVIYYAGAGVAVTDVLDLTSEFTISATNTINNAGGTASTGGKLIVRYQDLT